MGGFKPIGPSTGSSSGGFLPVKNNTIGASGFSPYDPNTGSGSISRIFIELNGVDSYYEYQTTLQFQAGDTFEFQAVIPLVNSGLDNRVFCDSKTVTDRAYVTLDADGTYNVNSMSIVTVDGDVVTNETVHPADGKLHSFLLTFTAQGFIGYLGQGYANNNRFDSIIINPISTISGVTTSYKLDEATADFELNEDNTFGPEEVVNGDYTAAGVGNCFVRNACNINNVTNQLVISYSNNAFGTASWDSIGSEGEVFLIEADIVTKEGSTLRFLDVSNSVEYPITEGTRFRQLITLGSSVKSLGFGSFNEIGWKLTLDNVSIKQVLGNVINYINIATSDRELFQLSTVAPQWDNISPPVQQLPAVIEIAAGGSLWIDGEAWNDSEDWTD